MVKRGDTVRLRPDTLIGATAAHPLIVWGEGLKDGDTGIVRASVYPWARVYFWRLRGWRIMHCEWLEKVDV